MNHHHEHKHRCGDSPRGFRAWFAERHAPDFATFAETVRARHGFGGGHRGGRWERGFGGGRERLFDPGDLKLVILKLLAEQPSYGYQLIKTMEERLAGGYAPSPGVIYPTLTLLEEEGLATSAVTEGNKKVFSVTPEGATFLETNRQRVDDIFARLNEKGEHFQRGRSPELMRAFMNLRGAVMAKVARGTLTAEQLTKIAETIDTAAKSIDGL